MAARHIQLVTNRPGLNKESIKQHTRLVCSKLWRKYKKFIRKLLANGLLWIAQIIFNPHYNANECRQTNNVSLVHCNHHIEDVRFRWKTLYNETISNMEQANLILIHSATNKIKEQCLYGWVRPIHEKKNLFNLTLKKETKNSSG